MQTSHQAQISNACYAQGKMRYAEDGATILNELGKVAKTGDIILRASNGYPLKRYTETGPVDLDLKTWKPIKVVV